MEKKQKTRVGLILSNSIQASNYNEVIGNIEFNVIFFNPADNGEKKKYCDLVITDLDLTQIKKAKPLIGIKESHGTIIILNKNLNSHVESEDRIYFNKASNIKYRDNKDLSYKSIKKIINAEIVKSQIKEGELRKYFLLINKHTYKDCWKKIAPIWFLLFVFIILVLHFALRDRFPSVYKWSLFQVFSVYKPDYLNDISGELSLALLIYSACNLIFYIIFIINIFWNINYAVFQKRNLSKFICKAFLFISILLCFGCTIILLDSFLIYIKEFSFFSKTAINIKEALEDIHSAFKTQYLTYYFLFLDISLLIVSSNYLNTSRKVESKNPVSTKQQILSIKNVKKSFEDSVIWNLVVVIIISEFLINSFAPDSQSKLAFQLFALQSGYLWINISSLLESIKHA